MQEVSLNQLTSSALDNNIKCQTHKQRYSSLLLDGQYNPLKCTKCGTRERFDLSKTLSIEDILGSSNETLFDNWPLFGENSFEKIKNLDPLNYEGIRTFFKGVKSTFVEQMEIIENKIISQYEILDQNKNLMQSYYNRVSQKENLVKSVQEISSNPEGAIKQIHKISEEMLKERPQIEKNINHCYTALSYYQDYLSISSLEKFSQSIKKITDSLEKVVNYEIYNLFGNQDNMIVALEQKQQFNNPVYCYTNHYTYNIPTISNTVSRTCSNCSYCNCYHDKNNISIHSYHSGQNSNSFKILKELKFLK